MSRPLALYTAYPRPYIPDIDTPIMSIQGRKKEVGNPPYLSLDQVTINVDSYIEDFKSHLLPVIKPSWKDVELDSKVFDSGITNTLVAIFDKNKGIKKSREDVILVRMNGMGTEKVISRADELVCFVTLHQAGLCPPLYARLGNGLCYGFFPGRQLRVTEVSEQEMSRKIACLLARLHCVEVPQHFEGRKPQVWVKVRKRARLNFFFYLAYSYKLILYKID